LKIKGEQKRKLEEKDWGDEGNGEKNTWILATVGASGRGTKGNVCLTRGGYWSWGSFVKRARPDGKKGGRGGEPGRQRQRCGQKGGENPRPKGKKENQEVKRRAGPAPSGQKKRVMAKGLGFSMWQNIKKLSSLARCGKGAFWGIWRGRERSLVKKGIWDSRRVRGGERDVLSLDDNLGGLGKNRGVAGKKRSCF